MNDDLIASDYALTNDQSHTLSVLLDTLLPESEDGRMPSAGSLDLVSHLQASEPGFLEALPEIITDLPAGFDSMSYADRHGVLTDYSAHNAERFESLLFHTYTCYYEDDRVLEGIGSRAGPPFPQGNEVEPGDLSLLDPVMNGTHSFRPVR